MQPPDVVEAIKSGDAQAFERLFREHYAALCSFADRYVRDARVAEELVQDVFAAIWARRAEWAVRDSVRGYLFGAVRNAALNVRKHEALERDWEDAEASARSSPLHAPPEQADEKLDRDELAHQLKVAMASLPERCRLVMQLRWHEQLSYAEIAGILGISVKGVENQLSRGLERLRGWKGLSR